VGLKRPPCGPVPFFALRTRSLSASYSCGVSNNGLTSSSVNDCRTNGGGFVGKGCVGDECSNGTSLFSTARSSIGQSGSPGARVETGGEPGFAPWAAGAV